MRNPKLKKTLDEKLEAYVILRRILSVEKAFWKRRSDLGLGRRTPRTRIHC